MNKNTDLILQLLKADLRNNRLLSGLHKTGLLAENFYLDLCSTIFQLIGFDKEERDDALYHLYFTLLDKHCEEKHAEIELYAQLLAEKKWREKIKKEEAL